MLRRENLRNPPQQVGLSTSDRVLVGLHQLSEVSRPTTAMLNREPSELVLERMSFDEANPFDRESRTG